MNARRFFAGRMAGCRALGAALLVMGLPVALTACGPVRQQTDGLVSCGGSAMSGWIGQPAGRFASQMPGVRVVDPGAGQTYDFRPERVNLHVDSDGIVRAITCG